MAALPALFGLLLVAFVTAEEVQVTPPSAVRTVGSELEMICKVPRKIESCRIELAGQTYIMRPGDDSGDVVYYGEGLQSGDCGAKIRNIQEAWNGNITCLVPPQTGSIEIRGSMSLVVAKPPQDPILQVDRDQAIFKEGDQFTAECIVAGGRPAASIHWLLDDEVLLEGLHQANLTSNGDFESISQRVTRRLSADDAGRTLVCKAEHPALAQPREAKRQLIVQYPPKVESNSITIFGLQFNSEGRLNVSVRANPPPRAEWVVGSERLAAPGQSHDAMLSALEPLPLGGGHFNVTLVIGQITKDDVDRTYYLHLTNEQGHEEISLRISTMEEPAGVELDTGAIVGIVIAVFIVLIAISLVVFAFATDRWCFAGRRRDNTKSSGESTPAGVVLLEGNPLTTDTESAVGGKERSRLAQLGARVRAALPKAKDKVQATETAMQDETDKPEEKVVYASLALTDQAPGDKPPPAFAEYAEIMYTEGKEGKETQRDAKEGN